MLQICQNVADLPKCCRSATLESIIRVADLQHLAYFVADLQHLGYFVADLQHLGYFVADLQHLGYFVADLQHLPHLLGLLSAEEDGSMPEAYVTATGGGVRGRVEVGGGGGTLGQGKNLFRLIRQTS